MEAEEQEERISQDQVVDQSQAIDQLEALVQGEFRSPALAQAQHNHDPASMAIAGLDQEAELEQEDLEGLEDLEELEEQGVLAVPEEGDSPSRSPIVEDGSNVAQGGRDLGRDRSSSR